MSAASKILNAIKFYALLIAFYAAFWIANFAGAKKPDPYAEPHGDVPHDDRL